MSNDPLVDRWDTFLAQIRKRFYESLPQAEASVIASLDKNGHDFYGSLRAQNSMSEQIENSLIRKIDATWRDQMQPALAEDGKQWLQERNKGSGLEEELRLDLRLWNVATSGKLAERYYEFAIKLAQRDFHCSQCGYPVTLKPNIFQSQYVACSFCKSVNTFVPETKYVQIGWNVIDMIAAYHALESYSIFARMRYDSSERGAAADQSTYFAAARAYCEAFCKARIALLPDRQATYDADVNAQMRRLLPPSVNGF